MKGTIAAIYSPYEEMNRYIGWTIAKEEEILFTKNILEKEGYGVECPCSGSMNYLFNDNSFVKVQESNNTVSFEDNWEIKIYSISKKGLEDTVKKLGLPKPKKRT